LSIKDKNGDICVFILRVNCSTIELPRHTQTCHFGIKKPESKIFSESSQGVAIQIFARDKLLGDKAMAVPHFRTITIQP
jgi:hypothetical protein